MIVSKPAATNILCGSAAATTAALITIPAGKWYTATISVSVTASVAGTNTATVTFTPLGSGTGPAVSTIVARCRAVGLLAAASTGSSTVDILVYGGNAGATLDYAQSVAGTADCVINGFLL